MWVDVEMAYHRPIHRPTYPHTQPDIHIHTKMENTNGPEKGHWVVLSQIETKS